jgi:hypothetical protein
MTGMGSRRRLRQTIQLRIPFRPYAPVPELHRSELELNFERVENEEQPAESSL